MWVLSRYADILNAAQDWQTYSSASGNMMTELPNRAGATLGTTDPPRHDRLRALVQHAFSKRGLEGLGEPMRDIARQAAEEAKGADVIDFKDFSAKFTVRMLMAALGLPTGDEAFVDEDTVREKAVLMVQSDPHHARQGARAHRRVRMDARLCRQVDRDAPRQPENDLISNFAQAEIDGDKLDEREVLLTTTTLIMAGVESLGGFMMMFAYNLVEPARRPQGGGRGPRAAARRDRGKPALQHLRAALPPPPDARRRIARPDHEGGRFRLPRLWLGQSRRPPVR